MVRSFSSVAAGGVAPPSTDPSDRTRAAGTSPSRRAVANDPDCTLALVLSSLTLVLVVARLAISLIEKSGYSGQYILQTARATDDDHSTPLKRYRDMTVRWIEDINR